MSTPVIIDHGNNSYSLFPYDDCLWFKHIENIGFKNFKYDCFCEYMNSISCSIDDCSVCTSPKDNKLLESIINDRNLALLNLRHEDDIVRIMSEFILRGCKIIKI